MVTGAYSLRSTVLNSMVTGIILILKSLMMSTCAALIKLKDQIEYKSKCYEVLPSYIK